MSEQQRQDGAAEMIDQGNAIAAQSPQIAAQSPQIVAGQREMSETPRTLQRLESIKVMDKPRDGGRSVIREVVCVYADELTQLESALAAERERADRNQEDAERLARGFWRLTKNMDMSELADYDDELASDTKELRPLAEAITFNLPRQSINAAWRK